MGLMMARSWRTGSQGLAFGHGANHSRPAMKHDRRGPAHCIALVALRQWSAQTPPVRTVPFPELGCSPGSMDPRHELASSSCRLPDGYENHAANPDVTEYQNIVSIICLPFCHCSRSIVTAVTAIAILDTANASSRPAKRTKPE